MKFKKLYTVIIILCITFIWAMGLYRLFTKNDEVMVVLMPLGTYLILRRPKQKKIK
jgi:multisubunit Na+/H+ antiporter MnhC subunit